MHHISVTSQIFLTHELDMKRNFKLKVKLNVLHIAKIIIMFSGIMEAEFL